MRAFQPTEPPRRRAARARLIALVGFVGFSAMVPISRIALATGAGDLVSMPWLGLLVLLYALAGLAAWLVWRRIDVGVERKRAALRRWGWQLLLSALSPAALYGADDAALALALLALSFALLVLTLAAFRKLQTTAAFLLLPYALWLGVAVIHAADRFWPGSI